MATKFRLGEGAEKFTCPYCKIQFKKGDEAISCPTCQTLHHASCWEENKGCTTFGCPEQHYETQETNTDNVYLNCGETLDDRQTYCPNCVQQVGVQIDSNITPTVSQLNSSINKSNKKKSNIPLIIGFIISAAIIVLVLLPKGGVATKNFNTMYSDIADKPWCEIAYDGTWMKIDTNPLDIDGLDYSQAILEVQSINLTLGFSSSVYQEMLDTRALDGRQSASCDKYEVSWSYHPSHGLEILYKIKN